MEYLPLIKGCIKIELIGLWNHPTFSYHFYPLALIHGFEMPQTIKNLPSEGSSNFLSANSTSPILFRPNLWESISTKTSMPFCDEYRQIRLVMWRSLSIPR